MSTQTVPAPEKRKRGRPKGFSPKWGTDVDPRVIAAYREDSKKIYDVRMVVNSDGTTNEMPVEVTPLENAERRALTFIADASHYANMIAKREFKAHPNRDGEPKREMLDDSAAGCAVLIRAALANARACFTMYGYEPTTTVQNWLAILKPGAKTWAAQAIAEWQERAKRRGIEPGAAPALAPAPVEQVPACDVDALRSVCLRLARTGKPMPPSIARAAARFAIEVAA